MDLNDVKYQNTDVFRISNLPILEFCNHRMTGAVAALRSLGRLYGYYPLNDTEAQTVDEIIYMNQKLQNRYWKACDTRGNQQYFTERYVKYLETYCAYLHGLRNVNSGSHYIVGDKMTVADLENANTMFTYLKNEHSQLKDKHQEVLSRYGSLE